MKTFRTNGAVGALLDEYEKAVLELQEVIKPISNEDLIKKINEETKHPDFVSIQSILTHVVRAGHWYVFEVRTYLGEKIEFERPNHLDSAAAYHEALSKMFVSNVQLFEDHPYISIDEHDVEKKIKTKWGQQYDIEQLFEHAIVHILRHRRQIERYLSRIDKSLKVR